MVNDLVVMRYATVYAVLKVASLQWWRLYVHKT